MILEAMPNASTTSVPNATDQVDDSDLSWWLEVGTANPPCIHYYGPFDNKFQAEAAQRTSQEASQVIYAHCKLCQPRQRTISEKELTIQDLKACPPTFFEALLGQHRIY